VGGISISTKVPRWRQDHIEHLPPLCLSDVSSPIVGVKLLVSNFSPRTEAR
jgi:hypothetical protein